jgi:hypothetical protein
LRSELGVTSSIARKATLRTANLPQGDVARGRNRPGGGPAGLVPFCTERCCDLTVGAASTTQLDDASDGFLFGLDRPGVAVVARVE